MAGEPRNAHADDCAVWTQVTGDCSCDDGRPDDGDEFLQSLEFETYRVPYCTCGTWDLVHEPFCGIEPAEREQP